MLRPGGRLALFWHVFQLPPDVAEALAAVYQRVVPDSPFNLRPAEGRPWTRTRRCSPRPPTGSARRAGSASPEQWRFDWEHSYTRDEWLDQLPTQGALTQLPPDELAEVLDGVGRGHRRDGRQLHDAVRHGGRHRGAEAPAPPDPALVRRRLGASWARVAGDGF